MVQNVKTCYNQLFIFGGLLYMKLVRGFALFILVSAAGISLAGCSDPKTMRGLADRDKMVFGVAVQVGDVLDPNTVTLLKDNFNLLVPENTMKWQNIRPGLTFWNWSDMDLMVAFAQKNKMKMKGHTFLWHRQNPPYVNNLKTYYHNHDPL